MIKLLILLITFIGILGLLLYSTGFLFSVSLTTVMAPKMTLVYQSLNGPYQQSGKAMDDIYDWLLEQGINSTKGFGYYFDSPKDVPQKQLRSIAGCIVEENDLQKLESVKDPYKMDIFPTQQCLQATFPYHGKHHLMAGILKVYPKLQEQARQLGYHYQVMEIYDIPNKKRLFLIATDKNTDAVERYFSK